jgi:hypothetical protein
LHASCQGMNTIRPVILALLFAPLVAAAHSAIDRCDIYGVKTEGELQYLLSRRAVDTVRLAAAARSGHDPLLAHFITPAATFSLGSGDVGKPLGVGVAGARALAREMNANTFRFLGWDYIPTPTASPCGSRKVEVEFTNTRSRNVFPVTFTFEAGRVVSAAGWARSFQTGPISPIHN